MRFSYPLRMSVIKRGDKEQKLAAFVSSYFSEIRDAQDILLIARSIDSPVVKAIAAAAPRVAAAGCAVRIILAQADREALPESWSIGGGLSIDCELRWARNPRLLEAHTPIEKPEDIARYRLIDHSTRPHSWEHWFRSVGAEMPQIHWGPRLEHFFMIIEAARAGLGMALLPTFLMEEELRTGTLIAPFKTRVSGPGIRSPRNSSMRGPMSPWSAAAIASRHRTCSTKASRGVARTQSILVSAIRPSPARSPRR